jgi:hypothetical protein
MTAATRRDRGIGENAGENRAVPTLTRRQLLATPLAALVARSSAAGTPSPSVWAVGDGEKVKRDDLRDPNERGSSVWDGRRVRLFGARNEVIAFQVVVEAGAAGIARASVRISGLARRGGGAKISYTPPSADPTEYAGRPIQLFSVNYLSVATPTHARWIFAPGSPAAPKGFLGEIPVQLVPENARPGRGGFPVRVAARRNQAFWIEIYTSRDLPAGVYEGRVEVDADGRTTALPVELELFDFGLADENSMHAMVYYEPAQVKLYQGRDLDAAYHRFAHRHRVELVHAYDVATASAAKDLFDGRAFSLSRGYDGPGRDVGNRIVPRTFYGPEPEFETRESAWNASDAWMSYVAANLPGAITFLYMPDEPGPSEYAHIRALAENLRSNPGPGRALPTFVTKKYAAEIDGAIDIWDTGPQGFDIARAAAERAKGRRYWIYNGGRPAAGAIVVDAPATDPRATVWACFKHGVEVYYYWHGVHWQHNHQKVGERRQNVWANPITFDNRGQPNKPADSQGYANGDGVLVYPGTERVHPGEDRGIEGPVSTVQLANFRRGLQDHQYLTAARGLGLTALVDESLAAVVPRVFSDAGSTVGFAEHGDAYERARHTLARAIAAASPRR